MISSDNNKNSMVIKDYDDYEPRSVAFIFAILWSCTFLAASMFLYQQYYLVITLFPATAFIIFLGWLPLIFLIYNGRN
jgi:hypothetical protein